MSVDFCGGWNRSPSVTGWADNPLLQELNQHGVGHPAMGQTLWRNKLGNDDVSIGYKYTFAAGGELHILTEAVFQRFYAHDTHPFNVATGGYLVKCSILRLIGAAGLAFLGIR